MMEERRRTTDSIEATLKRFKNSGYAIVAGVVLQGGMYWQRSNDQLEAQRIVNERYAATIERMSTAIYEMQANATRQDAIIAGQDRRIQMLEARTK